MHFYILFYPKEMYTYIYQMMRTRMLLAALLIIAPNHWQRVDRIIVVYLYNGTPTETEINSCYVLN